LQKRPNGSLDNRHCSAYIACSLKVSGGGDGDAW